MERRRYVDRENKIIVTDMRMLCWMSNKIRHDKIKYENIRKSIGISNIVKKFV